LYFPSLALLRSHAGGGNAKNDSRPKRKEKRSRDTQPKTEPKGGENPVETTWLDFYLGLVPAMAAVLMIIAAIWWWSGYDEH
jgi:hypothetical protein